MKSKHVFLNIAVLCFLIFARFSPPLYGDDQKTNNSASVTNEILAVFNQQVAAWNAGDLEAFMETYWKSEKLTFSGGGKTTRGWQATLDRYKKSYSSKALMGKLTFTDFEVTPLGNSSALALGRWHLQRAKDSPEGNFSVVLKKFDGKWKIIHDHSSTLEDEETEQTDSEKGE